MKSELLMHELIGTTRTLGRNHKARLVFEGEGACTDGEVVQLPTLPTGVQVESEDANVIRGYADHEDLHLRHTKFVIMEEARREAQATGNVLLPVLLNALEDMRCEKLGIAEYPGKKKYLAAVTKKAGESAFKSIKGKPETLLDPRNTIAIGLTWLGRKQMGIAVETNDRCLALLPAQLRPHLERWISELWAIVKPGAEGTRPVLELARRICDEVKHRLPPAPPAPAEGAGETKGKGKGKSNPKSKSKDKPQKERPQDGDTGDGSDPAGENDEEDSEADSGDEGDSSGGGQQRRKNKRESGSDDDDRDGADAEESDDDRSSSGEAEGDDDADDGADGDGDQAGADDEPDLIIKDSAIDHSQEDADTRVPEPISADLTPALILVTKKLWGAVGTGMVTKMNPERPWIVYSTRLTSLQVDRRNLHRYQGLGMEVVGKNFQHYEPHYDSALSEMRSSIATMRRKVERMLQARRMRAWNRNLEEGYLDSRRLVAAALGRENVFKQPRPAADLDTCVGLLVDLSGSMNGAKVHLAGQITICLAQIFEQAGIPFLVMGWDTDTMGGIEDYSKIYPIMSKAQAAWERGKASRSGVHTMHLFKDWNDKLRMARGGLGSIAHSSGGNNCDPDALLEMWPRISCRTEQRRIMLVLSDGQPSWGSMDAAHTYFHMKKIVKDIMADNIDVVGIGICDSAVSQFYPKYVVSHTLDEFATKALDTVAQLLLGERVRVSAPVA